MKGKISYYIGVIRKASFKKLSDEINIAHIKSNKSKMFILLDMIYSFIRFGAGYYDYVIFEFWNLTKAQRDTYLTRFRSKKFVTYMNDANYAFYFDNKNIFNEKFKKYIGREFLDLDTADKDDILDFYLKNDKVFAKMKDLTCGKGAELLKTEDYENGEDFYGYITEKGFSVIEEVVTNHPSLQEIYPFSVNTLRLITVIDGKGFPHCIFAVLKMGNADRVVDNLGLHGPVDIKTGEFLFPAHSGDTTKGEHYTRHPYSDIELLGYKVPMINEAVSLVLKAALVVPQMRYIGWDVAITPKGPIIIEGNDYCAHDFWQLPGQTPNGIGIMPVINKLIPEFKYK